MELSFQIMNQKFATEIVKWQYKEPYEVYGFTSEDAAKAVEDLIAIKNGFYAVLNKNELIGFRSFGPDGRVNGGIYDESHLDTGGGIRPDLTGKGLGSKIILEGLRFGSREFGTRRFRVTIADFNKRATKACQRIGFKFSSRFLTSKDNKPFSIFTIELKDKEDSHGLNR